VASVESALRAAVSDLNAIGVRWALVGGLAVSARAVPRFTKDLDFAVAVASARASIARNIDSTADVARPAAVDWAARASCSASPNWPR
jgi:hypothetical protein